MSARDHLQAQGTIIEVLEAGAYRAELPNGHRCIAHAEKNAPDRALGDSVLLAFHPYDLSKGRIVESVQA
jgi:translation initiation factor IF-1